MNLKPSGVKGETMTSMLRQDRLKDGLTKMQKMGWKVRDRKEVDPNDYGIHPDSNDLRKWHRVIFVPAPKPKTHIQLGKIMLKEAGADACRKGYGTTDPYWVGVYALSHCDINRDGTTN